MLLNRPRLHELLTQRGWFGFVGTTAESVTYLSGYWAMPQWIRRGPQAYAFQGASAEIGSFIVTGTGLTDQAADQVLWVDEVHRFGSFFVTDSDAHSARDGTDSRWRELLGGAEHADAAVALAAGLDRAGIRSGRIGIEEDGITRPLLQRLRELCPAIAFEDAGNFSLRVRAHKTPTEIARLRSAARIAERSIQAALAGATEGESECEMALRFHERTVRDGATPVLGCVGFGARSALPNVDPSPLHVLRAGMTVRFDVGGRYAHYRADIARIAAFGEVTAAARRAHGAVQAGIERAYEIIRPGLAAKDLFAEVVATVRRAGLPHYERNHVGHGIGLDGYEVPALTAASGDVLEAGMAMCIETPYYELGFAGFQVEDMVVVTPSGVESLMTLPRRLLDCPGSGELTPFEPAAHRIAPSAAP